MQKTLKKILEELSKKEPDLSYIRGMLEVLIEEDTQQPKQPLVASTKPFNVIPPTPTDTEIPLPPVNIFSDNISTEN